MNKKVFFSLAMLAIVITGPFCLSIHAQEEQNCGMLTPEYVPCDLLRGATPGDATVLPYVDIAIAFHIVRETNGSGGYTGDLDQLLSTWINPRFDGGRMRFFISSVDTISNSQFTFIYNDDFELLDWLSEVNRKLQAVNIYFIPALYGAHGVSTFTPDVMPYFGRDVPSVIIENEAVETATLPHEIGHYFNLLHTYEEICGRDTPQGSCTQGIGDGTVAGDFVADTPPDHCDDRHLCWVLGTCDYIGSPAYCPQKTNLMSYADICRVTFTQKQLNRARKTFDDKRPELQRKWVQFSNLIGTQNPGGSFLIDGTITVNSGGYVPFTGSNNHNARTNNERFSNHKHHDWNIDVTRYNLVQTFGLPSGFIRDNQDARFVQMSLGTVQNTLVDAPIVGSDSVSFRDPWYVANASGNQPNQFITYDAPLFPTGAYNQTTGGVFLNENPNFDAGKPNYSVGAPNPNTINGFTSYFLNWTGHPDSVAFQNANAAQTGVVFKLSGATARALYKANRYSLSPSSGNDTLAKLCEIVSRKQLKICC